MSSTHDGVRSTARAAAHAVLPHLRQQAAETDSTARFPAPAVRALRANGLMGLLVPTAYGGLGGDLGDLVSVAGLLGTACASTAMIWAMHSQQVDCLVRFGTPELRDEVLPRIAAGEIYLASVTTESEKGGHLLSGRAAISTDGGVLRFDWEAPVVTGGRHADAFLITMRESPDAADHRVSLCFAHRDTISAEPVGPWNPLGMRGTETVGMRLSGTVRPHQIVGKPGEFREVAIESMIPAGHLGWSAVWLGAARQALSDVVTLLRAGGRAQQSELSSARIAQARVDIESVGAYLGAVRDEVLALRARDVSLIGTPTQIHLNSLKILASASTFRAVDRLVEVAGLSDGYSRDSRVPLERTFRDLRSASLNNRNDRLLAVNGSLALLDRDVTLAAPDLM